MGNFSDLNALHTAYTTDDKIIGEMPIQMTIQVVEQVI